MPSSEIESAEPTETPETPEPVAARRRPALVRIPSAIVAACIITSVIAVIWIYLVVDNIPSDIQGVGGVLIFFAAAPAFTALLMRDSRWWVRIAIGLASFWIWLFWMFLVLIPIVAELDPSADTSVG